MRSVVAFVAESDTGAAEVLGGEQPVAELVSDLLYSVLSRRVQAAGQQLDTAPPVKVPDDLLVRHQPPSSVAIPRESRGGLHIRPVYRRAWSVDRQCPSGTGAALCQFP